MTATAAKALTPPELAGRVYPWLVRLALRRARGAEEPLDLAHGAAVRVLRRAATYDPARGRPSTWASMHFKYALADARRRARRRRLPVVPPDAAPGTDPAAAPDPAAGPEDAAAWSEDVAGVRAALARLAPADREILVRRYYRGEQFAAMAAGRGVTRQAAEQRVQAALARLRLALLLGGPTPHRTPTEEGRR